MNALRSKPFAKCAINSLLLCNGRLDANKIFKSRGLSDCDRYQKRKDKCSETKKKKKKDNNDDKMG